MRVLIKIPGDSNTEPLVDEMFIYGYESAGGTWTGELVRDPVGLQPLSQYFIDAAELDYDMLIAPVGCPSTYALYASYFYSVYGFQTVLAVGANSPSHINSLPEHSVLLGGAGLDGENDTGYTPDFFDSHPISQSSIEYINKLSESRIRVRVTPSANLWLPSYGQLVKFTEVSGWENNPLGKLPARGFYLDEPTNPSDPPEYIDNYYRYNKFPVEHALGVGVSQAGGTVETVYQSYSVPYIAGKLAYIKERRTVLYGSCSWWEARYCARVTASGNNIRDLINGYGIINVNEAINYQGSIPLDEFTHLPSQLPNLTYEVSSVEGYVNISMPMVPSALGYHLYNSLDEEIYSIVFNIDEDITVNVPCVYQYKLNDFVPKYAAESALPLKYKVSRFGEYSNFSNLLELPASLAQTSFKFLRLTNE